MKFTEILQAENPELATYTLNPGIVHTDMTAAGFVPYAKDTGMLSRLISMTEIYGFVLIRQ